MEIIGRNVISQLRECIHGRVLLFTQESVYSLFKNVVEAELKKVRVKLYTRISSNPRREEIQEAQNELKNQNFDSIIAYGGGSVIDFAKAFRYYEQRNIPLIAMPTTAGTGSQATQFAVVYVEGVKTSLDDPKILPDIVIADSMWVENAPVYVKAGCAMDAYCQGIESFWAKRATEESKNYAVKAIELCREYLVSGVKTNNAYANEQMVLAAHLAGKAINISRTTAAHALSYKITHKYNIPHGHAVALSIAGLFYQNIEFLPENQQHILLNAMKIQKSGIYSYFHKIMEEIGLEDKLSKLGIFDLEEIVDSVNLERLNNNPKSLTRQDLLAVLKYNSEYAGEKYDVLRK